MSREVQSALLIIIGGVLLRLSLTDLHLRYVKSGLQPYLVATAVVLIVIGLATLYYDLVAAGRKHVGAGKHRTPVAEPACCATSQPHGPRSAWFLVLPIAAVLLIAPPSLGAYSASRTGTATGVAQQRNPESVYPALPAGDPVPLPVIDYAARAVFEKGASLQGRRVTLVGFASPRPDGGSYLTRMMMVCCAADSRPIKVGLAGKTGKLRSDQWYEVTGSYDSKVDKDATNGEEIPFLKVTATRAVPAPENPYDG